LSCRQAVHQLLNRLSSHCFAILYLRYFHLRNRIQITPFVACIFQSFIKIIPQLFCVIHFMDMPKDGMQHNIGRIPTFSSILFEQKGGWSLGDFIIYAGWISNLSTDLHVYCSHVSHGSSILTNDIVLNFDTHQSFYTVSRKYNLVCSAITLTHMN